MGRLGLAVKLGERLLDDDALRDLYLSKIREGHGRQEAAALVNINYRTVFRYCKQAPEFLEEIREAEMAQAELVFQYFRDVMNDESESTTTRLKAGESLAKYTARDQRNDHKVVEHQHTHKLTGGDQLQKVLAIQERFEDAVIISEDGMIEA